jgi:Protein of unknown function (DUF4242)
VGKYLVEAYLPRVRESELAQQAGRARAAADELTREGTASVRYLRAIFLPSEETCFHLYEATSVDEVCEASTRAGITCERLVDVVDVAPRPTPPQARTNRREAR